MRFGLFIILIVMGITAFAQDSTLINSVINQLNLDQSQIYYEFVSSKTNPSNANETVVVIPEIIIQEDDYLELNCYILVVSVETGEITHKYIDRGWTSDAVMLSKIEIDNSIYEVSDNDHAFGIKGQYYTQSQPNPYSYTDVSLFVQSGNSLKKVLNSYDVKNYSAEWDTHCVGTSTEYNNTLHITPNQSNSYYDIFVDKRITERRSYWTEYGDCDDEDEVLTINTMLKFNGANYVECDTFSTLEVYVTYFGENGADIKEEPKGKTILNLDDDEFILTVTEAQYGWFKVINIMGVEGNKVDIPNAYGWIHSSLIGVSTSKETEILGDPDKGNIVGVIPKETSIKIVDKYLYWVEVEYNGISGWVKSSMLCGNPVTTCP
ncbi:MAG: SH3 domain-containing protein [Chitinophagales bacterium]